MRGLTNLTSLEFDESTVSDISPVRGLTNLTYLEFDHTLVSDISPVRGLTNLTHLEFHNTLISDLSLVAGLINLRGLSFSHESLSDLSPLAGLINLKWVRSWNNSISDLSPLAVLTKLETIDFCGGNISDLTPLAGLTGLKELYFVNNEISDILPLAGLTGLTRLNLEANDILDVSPLARLTNLEWLDVSRNEIANFSPLDRLRENIKLVWHTNPGFPKGGPKIEGPWLWVLLPDKRISSSSTDLLSEASGGTVTEVRVATHGATEGKSVGDDVWTSHRLPPTGWDNMGDMLQDTIKEGVIYGTVSLHSPRQQEIKMYVGSHDGEKIWLNGTLINERLRGWWSKDYQDFFPVTLQEGRNVLLVAVEIIDPNNSAFFGFEPGTEYTVLTPGVGYAFSKTPIHISDTFTLDILAEDVLDMAGWQFDIAFDPAILEAINVSEGNFLKTDGGTTFFQGGSIDNAAGKIAGLSAARLSDRGCDRHRGPASGEVQGKIGRRNRVGAAELPVWCYHRGKPSPAGPHEIRIVVEGQLASGDVNRDGVVSILDLILVARQLGKRVPANSPADVNSDGVVSILDLILVSQGIGNTTGSAAPVALNPDLIGAVGTESVDPATIAAWIAQARLEDDGSIAFKQGIENLEALLRSLIPEETALHP